MTERVAAGRVGGAASLAASFDAARHFAAPQALMDLGNDLWILYVDDHASSVVIIGPRERHDLKTKGWEL